MNIDEHYTTLYNKPKRPDISKYLEGKRVIIVGPAPYLEGNNMGNDIDGFDVVVRIKAGFPVPNPMKKDLGTRIDLWYTNLKAEQNHLNSSTLEEMERCKMKTIIFPYPITYQRNDVFRTSMLKLIGMLQYNFRKGMEIIQKHFKYRNKKCPFTISYDVNSLYFQDLEKIIGCRPTTGILAIMDLLQYDIKSLQVIGFTFRYEVLLEQEKQTKNINLFEGEPTKLFKLYSSFYKNKKQAIKSWQKTLANKTHEIKKELIFLKHIREYDKRLKIDSVLFNIFSNI